jgi:hypothetical protein
MFSSAINCKPLEGLVKLAMILQDRASELARLDRYERRALFRRKSAIRNSTPRTDKVVNTITLCSIIA